jgi:hypothetical protein
VAGGRGFEPRLTVPETAVLPLDEPPGLLEGYFTMGIEERQIEGQLKSFYDAWYVNNKVFEKLCMCKIA